jgi:hypothetical protein
LYEQASPNSYFGLHPVVGEFGYTEPFLVTGPDDGTSAFSAFSVADSKLIFSIENDTNAFASILIPGEVGGDSLWLSFQNHTELVLPGTTFSFLTLFPGGVSMLSLEGIGLSASSLAGFTYVHEGLAEISLTVQAVPEPCGLILAAIGGCLAMGCRRRGALFQRMRLY